MKINPVDKQQWVKTHGTAPGNQAQTGNFGRVLEETLKSTQASPPISTGDKIARPILNGIQPPMDVRQGIYERVDRILGTFDQYRLLLGDQRSSLKDVSRAMDLLKGEAKDLEATLAKVSDGDPLKSILNETLAAVSKEVFQFESGIYVD